jgi:hypothetical protein
MRAAGPAVKSGAVLDPSDRRALGFGGSGLVKPVPTPSDSCDHEETGVGGPENGKYVIVLSGLTVMSRA